MKSPATAPSFARRPTRRLALIAAVLGMTLTSALSGWVVAREGLLSALLPHRAAGSMAIDDTALGAQFRRFALNALMVPLLDDAEPPRWTDAALDLQCGPSTRVDIDGQPMVPGAPIPTTGFTVRWTIDRCWPLDYAAFELSGIVELQVTIEKDALEAIVDAHRLRVASAKGSITPRAAFSARLALGHAVALTAATAR
jgi:hypothetical protein